MGKIKKPKTLTTTSKPVKSILKTSAAFKAPKASPTSAPVKPSKPKPDDVVDEFKDFSIKHEIRKEKVEKTSNKSGRVKKLSKKDKQKLKKEEILHKIKLTQKAFIDDKEKKKREKTAVVRDLKPLMDALPSLDSLLQFKKSGELRTGVPAFDRKLSKKEAKVFQKVQKQNELQSKLDQHKNLITNVSQMTPEQRRAMLRDMTLKRKKEAGLMNDVTEKMED